MEHNELVERFRVRGYSKRAANIILKDVKEIFEEALASGESITLRGFGTFSVREAKPKMMNDVQTGERRLTPAHRAPRFLPSIRLRKICKQGYIT